MKKTGNDAILQLKGNQKRIEINCLQIIADQKPVDTFQSYEKAHGRIESRKTETYNTFNEGVSLDADWQIYAKQLISVTRVRKVYDTKEKIYKTSTDRSLYLASFNSSAEIFHHAIRLHWGIENKNHYVRDVTFGEDLSRIRKNPQNFAKLRSFALNILRKNKPDSFSPSELFRNALSPSRLIDSYSFLF